MAFIIAKWDLPGTPEALEKYAAKAAEWRNIAMAFPGFVSTRFLRNPLNTTPQTCAITEFETLGNAQAWLLAPASAELKAEMRAHGCSNFTMELWDSSPLAPEVVRANSGD